MLYCAILTVPVKLKVRAAGRFGSFENMRTKGLLTFDFQTFDTSQLVGVIVDIELKSAPFIADPHSPRLALRSRMAKKGPAGRWRHLDEKGASRSSRSLPESSSRPLRRAASGTRKLDAKFAKQTL